jgi:hypothetical protein
MKILIIRNTTIAGRPVFQGDVEEADDGTSKELIGIKKAVPFDKATDEQKKLIKEKGSK